MLGLNFKLDYKELKEKEEEKKTHQIENGWMPFSKERECTRRDVKENENPRISQEFEQNTIRQRERENNKVLSLLVTLDSLKILLLAFYC